MTENGVWTKYLIEQFLTDVISNNCVRLPPPAQGSEIQPDLIREIIPQLKVKIEDVSKPDAKISKENWLIYLTTAWCCKRWCSAYCLLSSVNKRKEGQPLLELLPSTDNFQWPKNIPIPDSVGDENVNTANKLYPYLLIVAILHEIGHAVHSNADIYGSELELACDRFAICYLLGKRQDANKEIIMLGLAIWFCCLCSESLNSSAFISTTHPNPVTRMERFLKEFVPNDDGVSNMVWMICVSHVMRLARLHDRSSLDEDVLGYKHHDLEALLSDLKSCW